MNNSRRLLMLAAENDALPKGKVGGVADVLRDAPIALAQRGWQVDVLTPAYGRLSILKHEKLAELQCRFAGTRENLSLHRIEPRFPTPGVQHWVLNHSIFGQDATAPIYVDDERASPFETDATRFALFCQAAAQALVDGKLLAPNLLHLHDWHSALLLLLREFDPNYKKLKKLRCVYTIHNLSLQGIRPLRGYDSALESWWPQLKYREDLVTDPRWPDCLNPVATAIRLADRVHTVSPSYAKEILRPSATKTQGYHGGEGLEADLLAAKKSAKLFGILNGCAYPGPKVSRSWSKLRSLMQAELLNFAATGPQLASAHFVAKERLAKLPSKRPPVLLTMVGRLVEQKLRLLREPTGNAVSALEELLENLGDGALLIVLGTGTADYEEFLSKISTRHPNLVYLQGYSEDLANALYATGDLFLMPSLYEPCGISQMLAMRAGQPCIVHAVGGLADTVADGVNGFTFSGDSLTSKVNDLLSTTQKAVKLADSNSPSWKAIVKAAAAERFSWSQTAAAYEERLYS